MTRTTQLFLGGGALVAVIALAAFAWYQLSRPPSPEALVAQAVEVAGSSGIVVTFADGDLKRWHIPAGHQLTRYPLAVGKLRYVRFTSDGPLDNKTSAWAERGLSLMLPLAFNNQTSGKTIEIGIVARRGQTTPSPSLAAVYATQQAGNSGWQKARLTADFELTTFNYAVPVAAGGYKHQPIAVFHADVAGGGKSVDLLAVYIRPLPSGR